MGKQPLVTNEMLNELSVQAWCTSFLCDSLAGIRSSDLVSAPPPPHTLQERSLGWSMDHVYSILPAGILRNKRINNSSHEITCLEIDMRQISRNLDLQLQENSFCGVLQWFQLCMLCNMIPNYCKIAWRI